MTNFYISDDTWFQAGVTCLAVYATGWLGAAGFIALAAGCIWTFGFFYLIVTRAFFVTYWGSVTYAIIVDRFYSGDYPDYKIT